MVYWADILYKYPIHDDKKFNFDSFYNTEPYVQADRGLGIVETIEIKFFVIKQGQISSATDPSTLRVTKESGSSRASAISENDVQTNG